MEYAKSKEIELNEPDVLYYGGAPLTSFDEFVGKELSFAKEYPNLHVAKIVSYSEKYGTI